MRQRVGSVIERLEAASTLAEVPNLKKLQADGNHYRIRVGDYRIGFQLVGDEVQIVRCLLRKDFYREFP